MSKKFRLPATRAVLKELMVNKILDTHVQRIATSMLTPLRVPLLYKSIGVKLAGAEIRYKVADLPLAGRLQVSRAKAEGWKVISVHRDPWFGARFYDDLPKIQTGFQAGKEWLVKLKRNGGSNDITKKEITI